MLDEDDMATEHVMMQLTGEIQNLVAPCSAIDSSGGGFVHIFGICIKVSLV